MDVPKDVRHLAGKTSWQHSLATADPNLAAQRRAAWSSHYKGEVIRLRTLAAQEAQQSAAVLVEQAFDKLARFSCSMDLAVAGELQELASIVRSSWSNGHAQAVERQHLGEAWTSPLDPEPVPTPSIDDDEERRSFQLRAEILEGNAATSGQFYQNSPANCWRAVCTNACISPLATCRIWYRQSISPPEPPMIASHTPTDASTPRPLSNKRTATC